MTESYKKTPSKEAQVVLEALRQAISKDLDRKRRLGQYAVVWKDGAPTKVDYSTPVESEIK
ncbi:MAG: hypothetical protein GW861_15050 [Deltaproteobacteria bacterium]|nr:hypothetical protein [Deltaproteobacteria bacterium]